ncbi:Intracellular exo-alpha-L-arabinofuranosidase 2 [compost metagenome]
MTVSQLSVSASRDDEGKIYVSICNLSHEKDADLNLDIRGTAAGRVSGRILTHAELGAHNTFEAPAIVAPAVFEGAKLADGILGCTLPPASVVVLTLE